MKMYLDANIIIYGYEASEPIRSAVLSRLWQWCDRENGTLVTSQFSRLECRVTPLRERDQALLAAYENFFNDGSIEVSEVSLKVIDLATELRAEHGFKSPDAVHLASAILCGADVFLTGDNQLRRCSSIPVEVIPIS